MAGLNTLVRTGARKAMRVGRGGRRGKTAGRGTKGQNARAGRKKRPEMRDIIKKLPKRRGYGKNRARTVVSEQIRTVPISLGRLEQLFEAGSEVTPKILVSLGVVRAKGGKVPPVKIVDGGTVNKKLVVKGCAISAAARAELERAGGSVA